MIGFGLPWQRFAGWAKNEDRWPKKLLYSLSGKPYPINPKERKKVGLSLREAGLKVLKKAITEFFTRDPGGSSNGGRTGSFGNGHGHGHPPQLRSDSQDHLQKMTAYIAATYAKFIAAKGSKGKEETYQEHLDRNDPMEGLMSMDDRASKSKFFVLVYGLIQGANMRRLFGELQEANDQLDIAQALLNYHHTSNNHHNRALTAASSAAAGGGGGGASSATNTQLPKALATRIKSFGKEGSQLNDGDRSNLQLRVDIVRAQVVRRLHPKIEWRNSRLAYLLQRIRHETHEQGYDVPNRFARFQELMCRLHVAYGRIVPSAPSASGGAAAGAHAAAPGSAPNLAVVVRSVSPRDEVMLTIQELRFLKKEYDAALKTAIETGDVKTESFVWLHRQFVKAELMNWEHEKLKSMSPADALRGWEIMLEERRSHLGNGHRHSVYAIRQVVRLRIELEDGLQRALQLLLIAMKHQQDEKWRRKKLVPLMKVLNEKLGVSSGSGSGSGSDSGSGSGSGSGKRKRGGDDLSGVQWKRR